VSGVRTTFPVPATAPMTRAAGPSHPAACCADTLQCPVRVARGFKSVENLSLANERRMVHTAQLCKQTCERAALTAALLQPASMISRCARCEETAVTKAR
jgi:hypothetical protein